MTLNKHCISAHYLSNIITLVSHYLVNMAPITLITAPPIFMPLEQFADFQASTPASGSFDHEPVLHHLEKNALVTVNPGVDGFDHVKNQRGDLYVTEA